jgi:hypothetical protein
VADPPRTAFGHLECPEVVEPGEPFDLEIGIAEALSPDSGGTQLERPDWSQGPYVLTIQLVAEGFTLGEGEVSRLDLPVTVANPYPSVTLHLTAEPQVEPTIARMIQASYYIGSEHIGVAYRPVAVVLDRTSDTITLPEPVVLGTTMGRLPAGHSEPDLTVEITLGLVPGSLYWTFKTAQALAVEVPTEPEPSSLGWEPATFTRQLINELDQAASAPASAPAEPAVGERLPTGLLPTMKGIGRPIEQATPGKLWDLLGKLAAKVTDRHLTVSIVSQDVFVPWELAVVDAPLDPASAPFLGAQVTLGRWILPQPNKDVPKSPPIAHQEATSMAVMCGRYTAGHHKWPKLEHAEAEAAALTTRYQATPIPASRTDFLSYLAGTPETRILHFAGHAIHDPQSPEHGLVMDNLSFFGPKPVMGSALSAQPFVFLNACQAGAGYAVLGSCAGFVAGFIYAQAAAVVAPIWSVNDAAAQEIARDFYRQALEEGIPPAEILRRQRARFGKDEHGNDVDPESAVCLAYQFFGHPNLLLTRHVPTTEVIHA